MKNNILRCIFDADLRCSHTGLSLIAKDLKVNTNDIDIGEYVIFINHAKTMVKIYAHNNVIAHYKSRKGQIDLKTLSLIPKYFNGRAFNYDAALTERLSKAISKRLPG